MTRHDAGKYAAKHPPDASLDPVLAEALTRAASNGEVTCAAAFRVVEQIGVSPAAVGQALDLLEYRITKCQLGLFGWGPQKKIVGAAPEVAEDLRLALEGASEEGVISCAACWKIAEKLGLSKLTVAAACDHLRLKVTPCQLGAF